MRIRLTTMINNIKNEEFNTALISLPVEVQKLDSTTKVKIFDSGQKNEVVNSIAKDYTQGEQIILQGHSAGGGDVQDVAEILDAKNIKNVVTVQIDSIEPFGDDASVPKNVTKAINVYQTESKTGSGFIDTIYPNAINGENKIEPVSPQETTVINQEFKNITGPATGSSANPHQNMDNDPRVQNFIQQQVLPEVIKDIQGGTNAINP